MLPPPMPVAVPSSKKPKMSICLREATSAPVTAKTAMPNQSRATMKALIVMEHSGHRQRTAAAANTGSADLAVPKTRDIG